LEHEDTETKSQQGGHLSPRLSSQEHRVNTGISGEHEETGETDQLDVFTPRFPNDVRVDPKQEQGLSGEQQAPADVRYSEEPKPSVRHQDGRQSGRQTGGCEISIVSAAIVIVFQEMARGAKGPALIPI
jgi:hypothetical protein